MKTTHKTARTLRDYTVQAFGYDITVPAGSTVSNKSALGCDDGTRFWTDFHAVAEKLTGVKNSILAHDLTYRGIDVPAEYCAPYSNGSASALKFTRADYMEKRCTHEQYYGQFVTPAVRALVLSRFPLERLRATPDKKNFNSIPLDEWDSVAVANKSLLSVREEVDGPRSWSLCGAGCILKEAARQLVEASSA